MIWSSGKDNYDKARNKQLPQLIDIPVVTNKSSSKLSLSKPFIPRRQTFEQRLAQAASQFRITTLPFSKRTRGAFTVQVNQSSDQSNIIKQSQTNSSSRLLSKREISSKDLPQKFSLNRKHHSAFKASLTKRIHISEQDSLPSMTQQTIFNEFLFVVNLSNRMIVNNKRTVPFKAYIERGNNGNIVKAVLNRRWWWHTLDEPDGCNLWWSQWARGEFIERMKKKEKNQDSEFQQQKVPNQIKFFKTKPYEEAQFKRNLIAKVINLGNFEKLSSKINKQNETYLSFGKKLRYGITLEQATSLVSHTLYDSTTNYNTLIHNHVDGGLNLHEKKLLLSNLKQFYQNKNQYPFQHIPLTFHIKDVLFQGDFKELLKSFDKIQQKKTQLPESRRSYRDNNIWICKPGQNSNRGYGITVVKTRQELIEKVQSLHGNSIRNTLIIQKYIEYPFLIDNRKFDIRCYLLVTSCNGSIKGYWYEDGYIRTASQLYSLEDVDNQMIHLTNDAVQKKGKNYGKFQNSNKLSFEQFEDYLERRTKTTRGKFAKSYAKMKSLARDLIHSTCTKINSLNKQFQFELFGLDFMLDIDLKPWIIQANSNPCLETSGPILNNLIPQLIDNVFRIAIDPLFPPPCDPKVTKTRMNARLDYFQKNKFQLIFDSCDLIILQNSNSQVKINGKIGGQY